MVAAAARRAVSQRASGARPRPPRWHACAPPAMPAPAWPTARAEIDADTQEAQADAHARQRAAVPAGDDAHRRPGASRRGGGAQPRRLRPRRAADRATLLDYQERLRKSGLFDATTVTFDNDPAHAERSAGDRAGARGAAAVVDARRRRQRQHRRARRPSEHTHRRIFGYARHAAQQDRVGARPPGLGRRAEHAPRTKGFYRNLLGAQIENLRTDVDEVLSQRLRVGRTQDTPRIDRLYFVGFDRSVQTTDRRAAVTHAPSVCNTTASGATSTASCCRPAA